MDDIVTKLIHIRASREIQVAAAFLVVYDHLLTFDMENRYISFMAVFVNLSGKIIGTCKPSIDPLREVTDNVIQALCFLDYLKRYGLGELLIVQGILAARITGMYMSDKLVANSICAIYVASATSAIVLLATSVWSSPGFQFL
ncbi:hypothetical protein D9619_007551 [Psilocybe cf. subviscida]|uniref:Uncharacterized protein n=1 Tax=Psilocybe cf. subviscida TaxID=2480587 RepID=A0A8H5B1G9_9AGAR|nr:hypothetical protein D9619_007551 [Psilocybe cf. subviscida]